MSYTQTYVLVKKQVSISNIEEDTITLVISWQPFGILRFLKNPQGLETHIRQYTITRMLENQMHNPWLPDYRYLYNG